MTLVEFVNITKCDGDELQIDEDKMNKEYIEQLEARHEENRKKREARKIKATAKEFVTNG
jgi:hypothetical protein